MVILLNGEFSSIADTWTEYLCLEVGASSVVLSSRTYEHLGEWEEYAIDPEAEGDHLHQLPVTIEGGRVRGLDYGSVVGTELTIADEITLSGGEYERAQGWIEEREWDSKPGFEHAWKRIETALRSVPPEPE